MGKQDAIIAAIKAGNADQLHSLLIGEKELSLHYGNRGAEGARDIGDKGAKVVADAISKGGLVLEKIVFWDTGITDTGAKVLAEALRHNKQVKHICFSYNKIGNAGAQAFASILETNTTLEVLDLGANVPITSDSFPAFIAALNKNTTLYGLIGHFNLFTNNSTIATQLKRNQEKRVSTEEFTQAGKEGHTAIIELGLRSNLDVNCVDVHGWAALHYAASHNQVAVIKLLLEKGHANIEIQNTIFSNICWRPLHCAAFHGSKEAITALLEAGADPTAKTAAHSEPKYQNKTPAEVAVGNNQPTIPTFIQSEVERLLAAKSAEPVDDNDFECSEAKLNELIAQCVKQYNGSYNTRASDAKLINETVCDALALNVEALGKSTFRYLAHLNNKAGNVSNQPLDESKDIEELEGWNPEEFLSFRIRFLFELLIKIEKGNIQETSLPASKKIVSEKIKQELITELRTYYSCMRAIMLNPQNFRDYLLAALFPQLNQEDYINGIANDIANLKDGKEYCYHSGYDQHSLYVNFCRQGNNIVIRVDNLGAGVDKKHPLLIDPDTDSIHAKPYIVGCLPIEEFSQKSDRCVNYLKNICNAQFESNADAALAMIYTKDFEDTRSHVKNNWPVKLIQKVGNCVVKNHNQGLQYRLSLPGIDEKEQRRLYEWVRNEERKYVVEKKHFKEYKYTFNLSSAVLTDFFSHKPTHPVQPTLTGNTLAPTATM